MVNFGIGKDLGGAKEMSDLVLVTGQVAKMDQVRQYFEYLFRAETSGSLYPVDLDSVWPFAYKSKANAKRALQEAKEFFPDEDYRIIQLEQSVSRPQGGGSQRERIVMTVGCFEFFIARKSRDVFEIYRECRKLVTELSRAEPSNAELPYHIRRYVANFDQVPDGHFSILNETVLRLIAPLEVHGHTISEDMIPDISLGKTFCKMLRDTKGINTDELPTYQHTYEDGRIVYPKAYPISLLPDFISFFQHQWLQNRALEYFQKRDPEAIPILPKAIKGYDGRNQIGSPRDMT